METTIFLLHVLTSHKYANDAKNETLLFPTTKDHRHSFADNNCGNDDHVSADHGNNKEEEPEEALGGCAGTISEEHWNPPYIPI